jgi:F0F1-type ATP synthase epsilon subunit
MRSLQEQIDDVVAEIKVVVEELFNISDIDDKKYYRNKESQLREKEKQLRDKKRLFLEKELLQLKHTSG